MNKKRAFSLIEMLIVLVIIGVLLAITFPQYQNYMRRARRMEAVHAIQSLRLIEEKYRRNNPQYGSLSEIQSLISFELSDYYSFLISGASATAFTITATALGDQNNDEASGTACSVLTFNFNNISETKTPAACWQ
jgi:type IV pilus assembly protein PilE